jgi:ankyrin repeat protein
VSSRAVRRFFDAIEAGAVTAVVAMLDQAPSLVDASGDGNANMRDKTPLMYALQCNHFGLARLLIQRGADVGARMTGGPRSSVIALAVRFVIAGRPNADMVRMVGELIDAGADPSDALWPACHAYDKHFDQPELIELLLARGADPDRLLADGSTARGLVKVNAALYSPHVLGLFGLA